jgi:transcriptional regulator with XRE-family HTH domain
MKGNGSPKSLREGRHAIGLTQAQVAELVGCSDVYVSLMESGQRKPGRDLAVRIERLTGYPVAAWCEDSVL